MQADCSVPSWELAHLVIVMHCCLDDDEDYDDCLRQRILPSHSIHAHNVFELDIDSSITAMLTVIQNIASDLGRLYVRRPTALIVLSDIDRYITKIPTGTLGHGRSWHLTFPVTVIYDNGRFTRTALHPYTQVPARQSPGSLRRENFRRRRKTFSVYCCAASTRARNL